MRSVLAFVLLSLLCGVAFGQETAPGAPTAITHHGRPADRAPACGDGQVGDP